MYQRYGLHADALDLKHICSAERLPFSLAYFGSLSLTLFFAVGVSYAAPLPSVDVVTDTQVRSTLGTLVAAIVQVIALLSYFAAYFPGGITTLRFGGQMLLRGAGTVLPI